jgi:hypothetical protein
MTNSSANSPAASAYDASAIEAVRQLRERFPEAPFLTLGQTVLWDEPTKATFCRILEATAPDARMVAAVHDTDYFAKLPDSSPDNAADAPFVLLEHNDGDTRALWSAAGEISALLGSETVPTRHLLTHNGVAFDSVAKRYPGGERALLNTETSAWGWRAIVHTGSAPLIAADVRLAQVLPTLREQVSWAFEQSYAVAPQGKAAFDVGARVLGWIDEFAGENPNATLSDLYRWLTPKLWCMARGGGGCNLETSTSTELFRFNRETCGRARFNLVGLFLNPETREAARRCYNEAVRGSGIYTLDGFGEGALPFDVVVPGKGRGTLRLKSGAIWIDTERPQQICAGCDPRSAADLAATLEDTFGPDVILVGKAVSLISMLAAEFIFVFHEKASSYTSRTQKMNACLREAGLDLPLHPMLRLRYETWDALGEAEAILDLPPHLAQAFGRERVCAAEFSGRWRAVCEAEDAVREKLKGLHSPRDLMAFLSQSDGTWTSRLGEYDAARERLGSSRGAVQVLADEIEALKARVREAKARVAQLERDKGHDFRARVQPVREQLFDIRQAQAARLNPTDESGAPRRLSKAERAEEAARVEEENAQVSRLREQIAWLEKERAHFDEEIGAALGESRAARAAARAKVQDRLSIERSEELRHAREQVRELEFQAELARLRRVRDAYAISAGLQYTNLRPTSWWFSVVSPDAKWFHRLAATAQARLEEL